MIGSGGAGGARWCYTGFWRAFRQQPAGRRPAALEGYGVQGRRSAGKRRHIRDKLGFDGAKDAQAKGGPRPWEDLAATDLQTK